MSNTKLKCAIISEGFTIKTLAKQSGLHEQTVRRACNGKSATIETANKICATLNKSLDELFGEENK